MKKYLVIMILVAGVAFARVGIDTTGEKVLLTGTLDADSNIITNAGNIHGNGAGLTNIGGNAIGANINFNAYNATNIGVMTVNSGIVVRGGTVGDYGLGRVDAQVEIQNNGTGHAMWSSVLKQNPGNTNNENAWSGQAYSSQGNLVQQGAFYMRWQDPSTNGGYSVIGMHPSCFDSGNITADVAFEVFGNHGIAMFNGLYGTPPTARYLKIKRPVGNPSIAGDIDLVLEANHLGSANGVFLNAYNSGNIILGLGGGSVGIGTSTPSAKLTVEGTIVSRLPKIAVRNNAATVFPAGQFVVPFATTISQVGGTWDGSNWTPGVIGWITIYADGRMCDGLAQTDEMGVGKNNTYFQRLTVKLVNIFWNVSAVIYNDAATNTYHIHAILEGIHTNNTNQISYFNGAVLP